MPKMKRLALLLPLALLSCEGEQPPAACGPIPKVSVHAGETATVTACFNDPNEDVLAYSATSSNPGATVTNSGTTVTVTAVAPGSATVTVTAADPGGLQGQQTFQVMGPNRAPVPVGAMPSITVPVGQTETADASSYFSEPDGEMLAYSATSSNAAAATVAVAGSAVTVTALAKGTTSVMVTATDPGGLTATQTFEATVPNRSPVAGDSIPDADVFVGDETEVDASRHFSDPDGDALTYSASSTDENVGTVSVTGATVLVAGVGQGSATVTVTATDPGGLTATQTFEATVPNRAPVAGDPIPDADVFVGDKTEVDASEHFGDPDGDALSYAASSSDRRVAQASVAGRTVTVEGVAQGSATVTVTATDPGDLSATQTFTVTVKTVPNRAPEAVGEIPDAEVSVDRSVEVDLAGHFSDPDGDALSYAATSADEDVATVSVSGDALEVAGVATGSAEITVTATDPGDLSATLTFTATVVGAFNDRAALVALYKATDGPNWANSENWLSDRPLDEWHGVTTRGGRVVRLFLRGNGLVGTLPAELGDLSNLERLWLNSNSLTDEIPPELGDLSNLEWLFLHHNSLTGALPSEFVDLSLSDFWWGNTNLCAPSAKAFQDWLDSIKSHRGGKTCTLPTAYLVQAVQSPSDPVPVIEEKEALLRVFVRATRATTETLPPAKATFYVDGSETYSVEIDGKSETIPTRIDEGSLAKSLNVTIPDSTIEEGLSVVIDIDPDSTIDASILAAKRIPESGKLHLGVEGVPDFEFTVIPFLYLHRGPRFVGAGPRR